MVRVILVAAAMVEGEVTENGGGGARGLCGWRSCGGSKIQTSDERERTGLQGRVSSAWLGTKRCCREVFFLRKR